MRAPSIRHTSSRHLADHENQALNGIYTCCPRRRTTPARPRHGSRHTTRRDEPMINAGSPHVVWMDDEWTVVTEDLSLSAHYENTILITKGKPEILSLTEDEKAAGFLELI